MLKSFSKIIYFTKSAMFNCRFFLKLFCKLIIKIQLYKKYTSVKHIKTRKIK